MRKCWRSLHEVVVWDALVMLLQQQLLLERPQRCFVMHMHCSPWQSGDTVHILHDMTACRAQLVVSSRRVSHAHHIRTSLQLRGSQLHLVECLMCDVCVLDVDVSWDTRERGFSQCPAVPHGRHCCLLCATLTNGGHGKRIGCGGRESGGHGCC